MPRVEARSETRSASREPTKRRGCPYPVALGGGGSHVECTDLSPGRPRVGEGPAMLWASTEVPF